MKPFLDKDFLLQTNTAQQLYHQYAGGMPIIDYHNHISPGDIANDKQFSTITELWLKGDHYKWRALRANGVREYLITGAATDEEKFLAWASSVPCTIRNPLYHWTHLELQRYFNIIDLLNESSAKKIYDECNKVLQTKEYPARNLLRKMKVEVLCTSDDPCDSLEYHKQLKEEGFEIKVLPAFRPDAAIATENANSWLQYLQKLTSVSGIDIKNFGQFIDALKMRHDFFAEAGCCISDHGVEKMYAEDYTQASVNLIFQKLLQSESLNEKESSQFKSCVLYQLALADHEKNWVQQWHIGALRNNNSRTVEALGADAGVDSIGDFNSAKSMALFLDKLDKTNQLAKTIVYNLNPAAGEVYASMMGNFQDGNIAGKMQYGAAWWFLDQKNGIEKQIDVISNIGLLSRFVGMTTDSRSFLSFTRHEYFRRILCNIIGNDIEHGEIPADMNLAGNLIQDICYYNAKRYFEFK
jgi:glucuronate isomerase